MLDGTVLRTRALTSASGRAVTISVIDPDQTPANRDLLFRTAHQWSQEAAVLSGDATRRAHFASDVAYLAATALGFGRNDDKYILVAQDTAGLIRGIIMYRLDGGTWELDLLTTDPQDQGGNPNTDPVRGIGSELLGAATDIMAQRLCTTVSLEPLDSKAETYWRGRGFAPASGGQFTISCPQLQELAARYQHSPHDDTDMLVISTHARYERSTVSVWAVSR